GVQSRTGARWRLLRVACPQSGRAPSWANWSNTMSFKYSVIRFSPRPGRGEALNVGVIVIDSALQTGKVRLVEDRTRLRAVGERETVNSVFEFLQDWKDAIEAHETDENRIAISSQWLSENAEMSNNLLQFSDPAPVVADEIESALSL